ncbi:GDP-mannose 4,6-dehydratase [bacterium]|nr:GDP-mannose 4,6-dehydratase [bacterium]
MRVAVTGGAGFIGSHLVDGMVESGHEVLVIDDLSSGFRENVPKGVEFLEASFFSEEALERIRRWQPEVIIHAAAQISVRISMENPELDAEVNVTGLLRLFSLLSSMGTGDQRPPALVMISTGGAMYGETDRVPTPESSDPAPESLYGLHKRFGELYCDFWARVADVPYAVLRLGNVYGPRQNPHGEAGVVAIFAERLLRGDSCTIYGSGEQSRDFIAVTDVVSAVKLVLKRLASGEEQGGPWNIGTGRELTVNALFQELVAVVREMGIVEEERSFQPRYGEARSGEQQRSALDPKKAQEELGWRPSCDLTQGLRETVAWFREREEV